jgi:glutamyl-tRNA synthetase
MSSPVRVRFAPSPTGFLHVGGARTALFNWLHARHTGGTFVLRIEDTDRDRHNEEAMKAIYDGLRWLGLEWDEGADKGGHYGPYCQSERGHIYVHYLKILQDKGMVYEDAGALRFRSPRESVVVHDEVCGSITFDLSNPGTHPDMTIRRPDGSWIFHFVNVVDDIEMKITDVIRGEDHLSNTPKHVELYKAFGVQPPRFAHIPLILNPDGSKMSKRDTGASVQSYMEQGYAPEAVRNYLCLLGWSPKDNREILPIEEIVSLFELKNINRRSAGFDLDKCFWMNGQYLIQMPLERFADLSLPFIEKAGINYGTREALLPALALVQEKVKHLTDVPAWIEFFFNDDYAYDEASVEKALRTEGALERLHVLGDRLTSVEPWTAESIEAAFKDLATTLGIKTALLVHPARVAATGRSVGPSLYHLLELLGRDRVLQRFTRTREKFSA